MDLKEKIQNMIKLGFTYGQLGKICKCHPSSISNWIRGVSNISNRMEETIENHINNFLNQLITIWR